MRKKGFTLIELLAVIIVLAIIALIATPIIFNVIENAKIKSLENSCYGVIDSVRTTYAENLLNSSDGTVKLTGDVKDLTVAGEKPIQGTWTIDNTKNSDERGIRIEGVKFASMKNYTCSNVDSENKITSKVTCEKDGSDEVVPTISAKQATITVNKGTDEQIKNYFNVTFGKTGGNVTCEVENVNTLTVGDHTVKCTAKGTNGKTAEASVTITVKEVPIEPNAPVLYNNMIPIKYESNKWVVANESEKWYDYDSKQWANAVVLNSGTTKSVGDEVTEEEISLWYVWIPRYKYVKFATSTYSEINITFETNTTSTGTITCVNKDNGGETCTDSTNGNIKTGVSTYTHPAFKFGDTELTGFWVGKFEVSGSTSTITIKPNVSSLRSQPVSSFFTAIQNIKTTYGISNADSHMMKNIEWGAVAYLKQSKYGLGTTDIEINDNENYYTGGGSSNAYKTNIGQSTTGNIYGVYDMSGGAEEYVMGNAKNKSGEFYSSGSGFTSEPDLKYYDSYGYGNTYIDYSRGKLGDATKEVALNTSGWYSDLAYFPDQDFCWFLRGSKNSRDAKAGVFSFNSSGGSSSSTVTSRAILSEQ